MKKIENKSKINKETSIKLSKKIYKNNNLIIFIYY